MKEKSFSKKLYHTSREIARGSFRRFTGGSPAFLTVWDGRAETQSDFFCRVSSVRREMGNPIHLCHPSLLTIEKPTFSTPILTLNPSPANQERGGTVSTSDRQDWYLISLNIARWFFKWNCERFPNKPDFHRFSGKHGLKSCFKINALQNQCLLDSWSIYRLRVWIAPFRDSRYRAACTRLRMTFCGLATYRPIQRSAKVRPARCSLWHHRWITQPE